MNPSRISRVSSAPVLSSLGSTNKYRSFSEELDAFYRANRCPYNRFPRICGREVDLHLLYTSVIKRGGYKKVCEQQEWHNVASDMQLPSGCTNISIALRRVYFKSLGTFEKYQCPALSEKYITQHYAESGLEPSGFNSNVLPSTAFENAIGIGFSQRAEAASNNTLNYPANVQDNLDYSGRLRNTNSLKNYIVPPWSPCLPNNQPDDSNTVTDPSSPSLIGVLRLKDQSELELIEMALLSGLPNEVDVALNSLLVLSATGSNNSTGIRLSRNQRVLRLLLSSVGMYDDDPTSLISCDENWYQSSSLNFLKFWNSTVIDNAGRSLLKHDAFIKYNDNNYVDSTLTETNQSDILFAPIGEHSGSPKDAFHYELGAVNESLELSRVLLVATLLVNLITPPSVPSQGLNAVHAPLHAEGSIDPEDDVPYEHAAVACSQTRRASRTLIANIKGSIPNPPLSQWRDNIRFISSSPTAVRFIFLCAHSAQYNLKQLGLQLVSCLQYPIHPPRCLQSSHALMVESLKTDEFWRTPWSVLCANEQDCEEEFIPANGSYLGKITLEFISRSIESSDDRNVLLAGLNLLTNMSRVSCGANTNPLLDGISPMVWARIAQLICLPDLALVCATLEALYSLTNLGTSMCQRLWKSALLNEQGVTPSNTRSPITLIAALISLVNLEGQAMGAGSLHRVKLMQRIPPPPQNSTIFQNQLQPQNAMNAHINGSTGQSASVSATPVTPITPVVEVLKRPNYQNSSQILVQSKNLAPQMNFKIPITRQVSNAVTSFAVSKSLSENPTNNSSLSMPQSSLISLLSSNNMNSKHNVVSNSITCNQTPNFTTSSEMKPYPIVKSKSLSELTDRLQMPPPTMPPPSVLRRANRYAKSPQLNTVCNGHYSPTKPNMVNGLKEDLDQNVRLNGNTKRQFLIDKDNETPLKKVPKTLVNGDSLFGCNGIRKDLVEGQVNTIIKENEQRERNHLEEALKIKENDLDFKQESGLHNEVSITSNEVKINGNQTLAKVLKNNDSALISCKADSDNKSAKAISDDACDTDLLKELNDSDFQASSNSNNPSNVCKSINDKEGVISYSRTETDDRNNNNIEINCDENDDDDKNTLESIDECDVEEYANMVDSVRSDSPSSSTSNNSSNSSSANSSSSQKQGRYSCEWNDCTVSFDQVAQISAHVYSAHLKFASEAYARNGDDNFAHPRRCCMWRDCSSQGLSRARFALMSHVLDIHCSENELESRARIKSNRTKNTSAKKPAQPNILTGNYDQSGWSVIRSVEMRRLQSDLWLPQMSPIQYGKLLGKNHPVVPPVLPPREGPVTKHLRVTAALVLQNLVTFLEEAKLWVWKETPMLCEIAFGSSPNIHNGIMRTNDAANIIARCLYLSNQPQKKLVPNSASNNSSKSVLKSGLSIVINKNLNVNKLPVKCSPTIQPDQVDMDQ